MGEGTRKTPGGAEVRRQHVSAVRGRRDCPECGEKRVPLRLPPQAEKLGLLDTILGSSPDRIHVHDGEGRYLYAN